MMHNVQSWYYLNFRKGTSRNRASEPLARLYELETEFFEGVVGVFFFFFIFTEKSVEKDAFPDWLIMTVKIKEILDIGVNAKFVHLFPL